MHPDTSRIDKWNGSVRERKEAGRDRTLLSEFPDLLHMRIREQGRKDPRVREWTSPELRLHHVRDIDDAFNIERIGKEKSLLAECKDLKPTETASPDDRAEKPEKHTAALGKNWICMACRYPSIDIDLS